MSATIALTHTFTGHAFTLEVERIRAIDEFVSGPDIFGIARRAGIPDRDFPVAHIEYDTPDGVVNYYALQSKAEIESAISGSEQLPAMARAIAYLKDLQKQGIDTVPVYTPFGTNDARPGAWRRGQIEDRVVAKLIANLEVGRPLAAETLDDLRQCEGRVERQLEKLEA